MASTTNISTDSFIFKNNDTFLSQENWMNFFKTSSMEGFSRHSSYEETNYFYIGSYKGIFRGLHISGVNSHTLTPVTNSEVDNLYGITYDGSTVKLVKITGIKSNANDAITFLSQLLLGLSVSLDEFLYALSNYGGISDTILPIAYGVYGHGYWDLSQIIRQSGKPGYISTTADSSATNIDTPLCGNLWQKGLCQIYGDNHYNVTIASNYTLGEYHLYPVPACSMDPANVYIRNKTSSAVTIKLPLTYRDMYFNYFTDNNWTENSGYLTYSLASGSELAITMNQVSQELYSSGGVNYPKSVYKIAQIAKNA